MHYVRRKIELKLVIFDFKELVNRATDGKVRTRIIRTSINNCASVREH